MQKLPDGYRVNHPDILRSTYCPPALSLNLTFWAHHDGDRLFCGDEAAQTANATERKRALEAKGFLCLPAIRAAVGGFDLILANLLGMFEWGNRSALDRPLEDALRTYHHAASAADAADGGGGGGGGAAAPITVRILESTALWVTPP